MTPLQQAREKLQLTQAKLAELADVDQASISRAERDDKPSASLAFAKKVVPHLGGLVTELHILYPLDYVMVTKKTNEAAA